MRIKIGWFLVLAITACWLVGDALAQGRGGRGGSGGGGRSASAGRSSGGGGGSRSFSAPSRGGGGSSRSAPSFSSRGGGESSRSAPNFSSRSGGGNVRSVPDIGRSASPSRQQFSTPRSGSSRSFESRTTQPRGGEPRFSSPRTSAPRDIQSRIAQPRGGELRSGELSGGDSRINIPRSSDAGRQLGQRGQPRDDSAAQAIRDAKSSRSPTNMDRRQQLSNRVRLPDGRPLSSEWPSQLNRLGDRGPQPRDAAEAGRTGRSPRDIILGGDRGRTGAGGNAPRLSEIRPQGDRNVARPNLGNRVDSDLSNRPGNRLDGIRLPDGNRGGSQRTRLDNPAVVDRGTGLRDGGNLTGVDRVRPPRNIGDAASNLDRGRGSRELRDFRDITNADRGQGPRDSVRIPGGRDFSSGGDRGRQYSSLKPVSQRRSFDDATAARLSRQNWTDRTDRDRIDRIAQHPDFRRVNLQDQWRLHGRGDVARQLGLHRDFGRHGGWDHRHLGRVSPWYRNSAFFRSYWGPRWFPRNVWYPTWRPWVSWSWNFNCRPWFDPRPVWIRPVWFDPCPTWNVWQYPVWQPLPVVASGTWVNVPQVVVEQGVDVQLLAVRFVDPGFAEQDLGPRYRVWLRNNTNRAIDTPFDVVVMGANERQIGDRRVETGQRVTAIDAGQTIALDMRLPLTVGGAGGNPFEFSLLHLLVDAGRVLDDTDMTNNGAVVERSEILPVDPYVFDAENPVVESGGIVNVAGEGLGPEPGQVVLHSGGKTYQPEILGWYDLGVRVRLPELPAADLTAADLVIIRGDGAAANPLDLQVAPHVVGRMF